MNEPTIDDAKAVIERTKLCIRQGLCANCQTSPQYLGDGWEESPHHAAWIKRCDECKATRGFPWADQLDPEKVLAFMKTQDAPFWLGSLEKTL